MFSTYLIFAALVAVCLGERFKPTWDSLDTHKLPAWYDEAKFGIFMHWGLYSVPSFKSEWFWNYWKAVKDPACVEFMKNNYPPNFQYADFAPQFTAEFFDPDAWADLIQASGAKYYIITSKHHEGFTMWRSNVSWNWNAVDAGPHRDVIQELSDSIRNRTDVHFGMYFSLFEWFHPLYLYDKANKFTTRKYSESVSLPQLYDFVTKYKPEYIWSDGDWEASPEYWHSLEFLAWLYNDSPVRDNIMVNDRWGAGTACKHGDVKNCHDKFDPHSKQAFKWEDATTFDKGSWGFRRKMNIEDVQQVADVIKLLIQTVSLGGNLLINVGPTHDGRIVPIFQERLLQLGSWMKINGEAIYATKSWRVFNDTEASVVWYTSKGDIVYALITEWPENDVVTLHAPIPLYMASTTVTMLGVPARLSWNGKQGVAGMEVDLNNGFKKPCESSWVLKLVGVK